MNPISEQYIVKNKSIHNNLLVYTSLKRKTPLTCAFSHSSQAIHFFFFLRFYKKFNKLKIIQTSSINYAGAHAGLDFSYFFAAIPATVEFHFFYE